MSAIGHTQPFVSPSSSRSRNREAAVRLLLVSSKNALEYVIRRN